MRTFSNIVAIIPARGGSKGIPQKNIYSLKGRPLVAWTIEQCRKAPSINSVYVSTDDQQIAEVSAQWGAKVIQRPTSLSGDTASSEDALLHALDQIESSSPQSPPDLIVFPQATSPLRYPDDFEKAIDVMRNTDADSLFSCNILRDIGIWEKRDSSYHCVFGDPVGRKPRQLLPTRFLENGNFYITLPEVLHKNRERLGEKIAVYIMDRWKSPQLDEPEDIAIIEFYLERVLKKMG